MEPSFDVISDLNLSRHDHFDWEGKPTSLYCIVAGNISDDLAVLRQTLLHLSAFYHGVFYIDGSLECYPITNHSEIVNRITEITADIPNVIYLRNNVVVVDGTALVGINGWYANEKSTENILDGSIAETLRFDDIAYLMRTVSNLQIHTDVRDILVVTNGLPNRDLTFGSNLWVTIPNGDAPSDCLLLDSEHKIRTWVYGSYPSSSTVTIDGITYHSNPKYTTSPYWPKRVTIMPRSRP